MKVATPAELFGSVRPADPLKFKDSKAYKARLKDYQKKTGAQDAVVVVEGTIDEVPVVLAVMNYAFMGGSMGSVVGEKITRAIEPILPPKKKKSNTASSTSWSPIFPVPHTMASVLPPALRAVLTRSLYFFLSLNLIGSADVRL